MIWRRLRGVVHRVFTESEGPEHMLEAVIRPQKAYRIDAEQVIQLVNEAVAQHLNEDVSGSVGDTNRYSVNYESDSVSLRVEMAVFRAEEILDWEEQKRQWHKNQPESEAERVTLSIETSEAELVDGIAERLLETRAYDTHFAEYS